MNLYWLLRPVRGAVFLLMVLSVQVGGGVVAVAGDATFLGMQIQGMSPLLAEALGLEQVAGVLVRDVTLGGPADLSGVHRGDLILRFGGEKIEKFEQLISVAGTLRPNDKVELEVLRSGGKKQITITVGTWPDGWHLKSGSFSGLTGMGVTMASLTDKVRSRFGFRWSSTGVVVTLIDEEKAPKMDIKVQDIIVQVNQEPVWSPDRVNTLVKQAKKDNKKAVLLLIERSDGFRFVVLPIQKLDNVD